MQTDPAKGAAPWGRGVMSRGQVLICPVCQAGDPEWADDLDACAHCGSTRLSVVLGSVVCRACGAEA